MKLFSISICVLLLAFTIGHAGPESRDVTVAEAAAAVENTEGLVILDVRTPMEFKGGHLKGAKLIDFTAEDFEKKIQALDKDATYLLHCASGYRSGQAMEQMTKLGFKSILHLKAGYAGWTDAGKPVTTDE